MALFKIEANQRKTPQISKIQHSQTILIWIELFDFFFFFWERIIWGLNSFTDWNFYFKCFLCVSCTHGINVAVLIIDLNFSKVVEDVEDWWQFILWGNLWQWR